MTIGHGGICHGPLVWEIIVIGKVARVFISLESCFRKNVRVVTVFRKVFMREL